MSKFTIKIEGSILDVGLDRGKVYWRSQNPIYFKSIDQAALFWEQNSHTLDMDENLDLIRHADVCDEDGQSKALLVRESSKTQINRLYDFLMSSKYSEFVKVVDAPSVGKSITLGIGDVYLMSSQRHNSKWYNTPTISNGRVVIGKGKIAEDRVKLLIPRTQIEFDFLIKLIDDMVDGTYVCLGHSIIDMTT